MKHDSLWIVVLVVIAVAIMATACREDQPASTPPLTSPAVVGPSTAEATAVPTPRPQATARTTARPTLPAVTATPTREPTATSQPEPTVTPSPKSHVVQAEPTLTPLPGDHDINVDLLPLNEPGHYVSVTFGYWLQYPLDWYTHFGNRPLLVSLSNLDPGTHNRQSMREQGCLIEVNASPNIYGFTFEALAAQLPRSFPGVMEFELAGEKAWSLPLGGSSWESEWVYVEHDGRLFTLVFDWAQQARDACRPAWESMLASWRWFEPALADYRNRTYGYSISYPRRWFRFNAHEPGISISDHDPADVSDWLGFLSSAMVVETNVFDNDRQLPLKEWLVAYSLDVQQANDIPLDELIGVRIIMEGPGRGIEAMNGYFQGPLGRIYEISCLYPVAQRRGYQPIANAIIYSFHF